VRIATIRPIALVFTTLLAYGEDQLPPTSPGPELLKGLQVPISSALRAYNAADIAGMRQQFSVQAPGLADASAFRRLFIGYYSEELGRVKSLRLVPAGSDFDPDNAMLVFAAEFERSPLVKVSANYTREAGTLKLIQLRFEKVEAEE
jgi:hypothetical protein